MRLRMVPVREMKAALAIVEEHNLPLTLDELEAHHLAGGDVDRVLRASLKAQRRGDHDYVRPLLAANLAGEDLDAFVERGYLTEDTLCVQELIERATSDPEAAAELHTRYSNDLAALRQTMARLDKPSLVIRLAMRVNRRPLLDQMREAQRHFEEKLATLESRWPQLRARR